MVPLPKVGKSARSSIWKVSMAFLPWSMGWPERKKPRSAFSLFNLSLSSISGISGYSTESPSWESASIMEKRESCPEERSFRAAALLLSTSGTTARSWLRWRPKQSRAPERTKASRRRAFTPQTRLQKSSRLRKGPSWARASRMVCTIPSPTPLMAASPKRISFPLTEKDLPQTFTSGGRIRMPISRHSFR